MTLPNPPGMPPETRPPDKNSVVAPDTPGGVFAAVESMLHRTFGLDGQVERVQTDENSATFGMMIAGTDYSLMLNKTP